MAFIAPLVLMDTAPSASRVDEDPGPFRPLSEALGSARRCGRPLADAFLSPRLAFAWAEAVVRFWMAARDRGRLSRSDPLLVLDLHPETPRLAALMLPALRGLLRNIGEEAPVRYVAVGIDPEDADAWRQHPALVAFAERGWLETTRALPIDAGGNPVVALAAGTLSSARADLYAVHHGEVLAGEVHVGEGETPGTRALRARYRKIDPSEPATPSAVVLRHYGVTLNSAPLLIPVEALQTLEALSGVEAGYLFIAADLGIVSPTQLRLGAMSPPTTWSPRESLLPVDFYALSVFQRMQGARTHDRQLDESGWTLHAACRDPDDETFASLAACLDRCHPADAASLVELARGASTPGAALALLRLSGHDQNVLAGFLAQLLDAPGSIHDAALPGWRDALERTWDHFFLDPAEPDLHTGLASLAARLGHFGLAREIFETGLHHFGRNLPDLSGLAAVEAATGRIELALALASDDPECVDLRRSLDGRRKRRDALGWRDHATLGDGDLALEPLGPEHAAALHHQYRDPEIAQMARLPALPSEDDARRWIDEQDALGQPLWAVVHADLGFAGVVSLRRSERSGFFYFWIGVDFQQRGLGTRAAALMRKQAEAMSLSEVFTIAWTDNTRSLAILARFGFAEIDRFDYDGDPAILFQLNLGAPPCETPAEATARYRALFDPSP